MGKKRKSDLEIIVEYFTVMPLAYAEMALGVAKAIVAGRSPTVVRSVARPRGKKKSEDDSVSETLGNA